MIQPSETRIQCNLLWLYTNPQLERRSIDGLFEEYGNAGEYSIDTSLNGFVTMVGKRLPDDERRCMTDVMETKREIFAMMMTAMTCFVEEYRSTNEWVMGEKDKARAANLEAMEVPA